MRGTPVVPIRPRETRRRVDRAAQARRRLDAARHGRGPAVVPSRRDDASGRAWINGREVGGRVARFAHLARTHD